MPALAACAIGRNKLNFLDVGEERVHRAWVRRSHRTRKVLQLALGQKRDRAGDRVPSTEGLDDRRECRGDSGRGAAHEARGVHPHARREECPRGRRSHLCTRVNYLLRERGELRAALSRRDAWHPACSGRRSGIAQRPSAAMCGLRRTDEMVSSSTHLSRLFRPAFAAVVGTKLIQWLEVDFLIDREAHMERSRELNPLASSWRVNLVLSFLLL